MPGKAAAAGATARPGQSAEIDEEAAFPRGGGSAISPLERRKIRQEAQAEAAHDLAQETQQHARKRKRQAAPEDDADGLQDTLFAAASKLPRYVDLLKFRGLSVGAKLWGAVAEVHASHLVVSLPDGLKGHVQHEQASDLLAELHGKGQQMAPLASLFSAGQLVRGTVSALRQGAPAASAPAAKDGAAPKQAGAGTSGRRSRKAIELSLEVSRLAGGLTADALTEGMALPACIRSVEDHGYTLMLGVPGTTGFLRRADHEAAYGAGAKLQPGALLETVVQSAKHQRLIRVTTEPAAVRGALAGEAAAFTIGTLMPGMLVKARVRGVLGDGLLLQFLSYFNGTVNIFHLTQAMPGKDWAKAYAEGQKLRARIIHVDPSSKKIGLSLQPHLLGFTTKESLPAVGTLFEDATVRRVSPKLGLTLELPTDPESTAGFAHVSNVADRPVTKLEKAFTPGQQVRARVIGARLFDGLSVLSLKPSLVEAALLSLSEVQPGSAVTGEVSAVQDFGIILKLAPGVRALVPALHLSDLPRKQTAARFKVGQKVSAHVLEVAPATQRITATLKRGLCRSKLPRLTSLLGAEPGLRAHGWVTGVKEYGVFVSFFGGVKGLAHSSQLGLAEGQKPQDCFHEGQVVKCTVLRIDHSHQRLSLSLASKATAAGPAAGQEAEGAAANGTDATDPNADPLSGLQPGDVVEGGTVTAVEETAATGDEPSQAVRFTVQLDGTGVSGHLAAEQLADSPQALEELRSALRRGSRLGRLLVLERCQAAGVVRLSRKASLLAAAHTMPRDFAAVRLHTVAPGFVHNVAPDAVYVRFLGGVTGRAGLPQLSDAFASDPASLYTVGQSVQTQVVQVDAARQRFLVTLKPSVVGSRDAAYLRGLFADMEAAEALRAAQEDETAPVAWSQDFPIGGAVQAAVLKHEAYGVVCDLAANADLVGLAAKHQAPEPPPAVGAALTARVLDVHKEEGIIDLSLQPPHLQAAQAGSGSAGAAPVGKGKGGRRKRKAEEAALAGTAAAGLQVSQQEVPAVVELLHSEYAVLSLPRQGDALGFAALRDFNQQTGEGVRRLVPGQRVQATIAALPEAATGGRLLLHVPLAPPGLHEKDKASQPTPAAGVVLELTVVAAHPTFMEVSTDSGQRGRVDISEVLDDEQAVHKSLAGPRGRVSISELTDAEQAMHRPLAAFQEGQAVTAVCLGLPASGFARQHHILEFSMRPSALAAARAGHAPRRRSCTQLSPGQQMAGWVVEVQKEYALLQLSADVRGRLSVLDCCADGMVKHGFTRTFPVGRWLSCRVLRFDAKHNALDLSAIDPACGSSLGSATAADAPAGAVLSGRVEHVSGACVRVRLGPRAHAVAALTELHDDWQSNALDGRAEGQYVRCYVLTPAAAGQSAQVSLRPSLGMRLTCTGGMPKEGQAILPPVGPKAADLTEGQEVQGYVKSVSKAGVFVCLAQDVTARIKLGQLADQYVAEPAKDFPPGKLVNGRVLSADPRRIELTLRTSRAKPDWQQLQQLIKGEIVRGAVRRVEAFGVFVQLQNSTLTGLAHKSELSDDFVKAPEALFAVGQGVRAMVLDVDNEQHRLSLGLKASYFAGVEEPAAAAAGAEQARPDLEEQMLQAAGSELDSGDEEPGLLAELQAAGVDVGSGEGDSEAEAEEGQDDWQAAAAAADEAEDSDADEPAEAPAAAAPPADLGPVGWGDDEEEAAEAQAVQTAPAEPSVPERRRMLKAARRREKAVVAARAVELAAAMGTPPAAGLTSAAAHEEAVAAAPDRGRAWTDYMTFLASVGEPAAARAVAERALRTINIRAEDEKFAVWLAWLRMELLCGAPTPAQAAAALFQRALTYCDQKRLYMAFIGLLDSAPQTSELAELAEQTLRGLTRKFSGSAKAWMRRVQWLLERGQGDAARRTLDRALGVLPPRKHIKVITRAALLEFRTGNAERGRSLFEGCLRNYPARLDIWSQYLDQEIKLADLQRTRALFERVVALQLPPKKMKFLFKRYLAFEEQRGDVAAAEHVRKLAMQYVEEHGA